MAKLLLLASAALAFAWLPAQATTRTAAGAAVTAALSGTPAGLLPAHINADGTAVLPDGRFLTPAGRTAPLDLVPLNSLLSHDGRHLFVSDDGEDNTPLGAADSTFNRFISVVDTATLQRTRVADNGLQSGLAESADGTTLFSAEGATDSVGVFSISAAGGLTRAGAIALTPHDFPWGMAISGRYLYVTGFMTNSLDVVDITTRTLVTHVATGEFPFRVAVSPDGTRLYISNMGVYNTEAPYDAAGVSAPPVATPPVTAGGYNMPQSSSVWTYDLANPVMPVALQKTRIGADVNGFSVLSGSLPGALAASPDGRLVAVTASNHDLVALLDARSGALVRTVDMRATPGGPTGMQPDAVAFSPDSTRLYVAEGGRNDVSILSVASGAVLGRIPTGWYPSALSLSGDGRMLYVTSAKGLGTGTNGALATGPTANNDHYPGYIGSLLHGLLQQVDLSVCNDLATLTAQVDVNNGVAGAGQPALPGDAVVPPRYGVPSALVKHVVFILKENRTYDQILGDLQGTERSQSLAAYSGRVTPNEHAIASQFAVGDNFYTTSQSSTDGHFLYGTGQENEFDQKTVPSTQANAFQGSAAGIVNTSAENLPLGGFLWHNAARSGVTTRIYGEADALIGLGPNNLPIPSIDATNPAAIGPLLNAQVTISPTYPTNLQSGMDAQRADDIARELSAFDRAGAMPTLSYLLLPDDHTDGSTPGHSTPETFISQNDNAVGRIVDSFSHSSFWKDTAIFITEDDTQGGQDHVDAQRTVLLAAGPFVRRGDVSHVHHSTTSLLKTIDLLIGAQPTSAQEAWSTPMTDLFQPVAQLDPRFTALPRQVADATNPTLATAANAQQREAILLQESVPSGVDRGGARLADVLRLAHSGAVAAGDGSVPPTPAAVEHRLRIGDVSLGRALPRGCGALAGGPGLPGAVTGGGTPSTQSAATGAAGPAGVLGITLLALAARCRRGQTGRRADPAAPGGVPRGA